jgi:hypothetical protein
MWQDPIITETRALREEYAHLFDHDHEAIFQDIRQKQAQHQHRLVSFRPRQPIVIRPSNLTELPRQINP